MEKKITLALLVMQVTNITSECGFLRGGEACLKINTDLLKVENTNNDKSTSRNTSTNRIGVIVQALYVCVCL